MVTLYTGSSNRTEFIIISPLTMEEYEKSEKDDILIKNFIHTVLGVHLHILSVTRCYVSHWLKKCNI